MLFEKQKEFKEVLDKVESLQKKHATTIDTRDLKIRQLETELDETCRRMDIVSKENEDLTVDKQGQIADLVAQLNGFEEQLSMQVEHTEGEKCDLIAKNASIRIEMDERLVGMEKRQKDIIKAKDERLEKAKGKLEESEERRQAADTETKTLREELRRRISEGKEAESDGERRAMDALDMVEEREKIIIAVQTELEKREQEVTALTKHAEMMNDRMKSMRFEASAAPSLREKLASGDMERGEMAIELEQLRKSMQTADGARLDIAIEREAMVRENAKTKKMARGIERKLNEMEEQNRELSEELKRVKSTASEDKQKQQPPSSPERKEGSFVDLKNNEAIMLSPTFTESLTERHNSVIEELNCMKMKISTELTPRKKRKQNESIESNSSGNNNLVGAFEQKNELLRHMEMHVDSLVAQLTQANTDLVDKDNLLGSMADAIGDYENELTMLKTIVSEKEEMVTRESDRRKTAEEEFSILKDNITEQQVVLKRSLENTNFSQEQQQQLQSKLLKTDRDWSIKFEAAQQICGGLAAILGGAFTIAKTKEKKMVYAFMKWREFSLAKGHDATTTKAKSLEREKNRNQQLLIEHTKDVNEREEAILSLERR